MMNKIILSLLLLTFGFSANSQTNAPLRVFIRAGVKTHGPDQHDHPRFLKEWTALLNERGAQATGGMEFPTAAQLAQTDVILMYAGDAGDITTNQRVYLDEFLKRGGGIVMIHDSIGSHDPNWVRSLVGGSWTYGHAKWFEGPISFYYTDHDHPITRDASNVDLDDEQYYEMEFLPEAHVLAVTFTPDERNKIDGRVMPSIFNTAPQMWTYEKDNYRAFVSIPGHNHKTFSLPQYRAVLLRGIAWVGKRPVDALVSKEELASLMYPVGGPTSPEEAVKKIQVQPGFHIQLVASEPVIEKPISMDWDPQGRLWIAETPEYPFRKDRARAPYDRISILESSHHDGRLDKKTIWSDDLDLVTSMLFYQNGVIVSQAPYILRLSDTKGAGKADKKEILYRGFGTNDTHAVVNNLRWGLDGWIYATIGYTRGDIYSGDGKTHFGTVSEGVIRFKPDGSAIEQVSSKGGNTWGVDVGPDNEVFFSQANGSHINHVVVPETILGRGRGGHVTSYSNIEDHNRSYPLMSWKNQAYVQIDWVGNFTAAAGCCIYDGGAWPDKFNYTEYVSEPTLNIVHQDYLRPRGASYVASKDSERAEQEFIASTDLWFRPIHQRVGPDGALYILDFYNQAVVHNDPRGPRHDPLDNAAMRPDRNHHFGRIWRVQNDEAKPAPVPKLAGAKPAALVKALEHPNEWVRLTALRLLLERAKTDIAPQLEKLASSETFSVYARVHALWLLSDLNALSGKSAHEVLSKAIASSDPTLAKNALEIAGLSTGAVGETQAVVDQLQNTNARVRLEAIIALAQAKLKPEGVKALVAIYPELADEWSKSAFMGVAGTDPVEFVAEALRTGKAVGLISALSAQIGEQQDAAGAAKLVTMVAQTSAADDTKEAALAALGVKLKAQTVPVMSADLETALRALLISTNAQLSALALPLAAHWDATGSLRRETDALVEKFIGGLKDTSASEMSRVQLAKSLLAVRQSNSKILPAVAQLLSPTNPQDLQGDVIAALGELPDATVADILIAAYPQMPPPLQDAALNQLFKRADWSLALVHAIETRKINLGTLGPVAVNRLRTHSNLEVASAANQVIDQLRGPEVKEKDKLIAEFTPIVTQPGDPVRGKQLFTQTCAVCHTFNGQGKDVAPNLTGMGAHGPAQLIVDILDPNREVEPNYYAYSIETTDGEIYDGVIAHENRNTVTLKNAAGSIDIDVKNIKTRKNTGLSLMPNGFDSLGPEVLRDILAYLCAGDANYRLLDLKPAFNVNSNKGLWNSADDQGESLQFIKFGLIKVGDVPFEIENPLKSSTGKNLVILQGGSNLAKTYPQRVEIPNVGFKASKLHFLGGIGGWAYPWGGEHNKDVPIAKVTVHYMGASSEEFILKNGEEFGDWIGSPNLPGSQLVPDLVRRGQVREFTKTLANSQVIQSISLESFNNFAAPAFIAITAEIGNGSTNAPAPKAQLEWKSGTSHVLIVGGGSSHDFRIWFGEADGKTLESIPGVVVNYTEDFASVPGALSNVDVLFLTSNQPLPDGVGKAITEFADAGRGLLLVHPALWFNWDAWPEYHRMFVGGGARTHDKYGKFEVTVKEPDHPIMAGVPALFEISDELYHFEKDPQGVETEVLAEGKNPATGATYPVVWVVKNPKARIVCITLGHDAGAHELAAYQTILKNAERWVEAK